MSWQHRQCEPGFCDWGRPAECPHFAGVCAHPNVVDVLLGNDELPASERETGWECIDCGRRSWE
jgi:hypothetical protein